MEVITHTTGYAIATRPKDSEYFVPTKRINCLRRTKPQNVMIVGIKESPNPLNACEKSIQVAQST